MCLNVFPIKISLARRDPVSSVRPAEEKEKKKEGRKKNGDSPSHVARTVVVFYFSPTPFVLIFRHVILSAAGRPYTNALGPIGPVRPTEYAEPALLCL